MGVSAGSVGRTYGVEDDPNLKDENVDNIVIIVSHVGALGRCVVLGQAM